MQPNKNLVTYLVRFLGLFGLLFYGTEAIIGFSTPDGHYSRFVADYLDYITPFRQFLLVATKAMLALVDVPTVLVPPITLRMVGGSGIRLAYDCIGYGVLSFWIAFVFANQGSWQRKAAWMIGGAVWLCGINIIRLGLVLVATNRGWPIPLGWDHHTWFNIVAYGCIFTMIWLYDRQGKKSRHSVSVKKAGVQQTSDGTPIAGRLLPSE